MTLKRGALIPMLLLFASACAHQQQEPPPKFSTADLFGVQEITLDTNGKRLTLMPLLDTLAHAPLSRQINAAFAFDPTHAPTWMFDEAHPEVTAFHPPQPIVVDQNGRDILQRDINAILQAVLEQERRHNFHGYVTPAAASETFTVEIVDSDDAGIVRANCATRRTRISTGFIRRLLERSIASALTERMLGIEDKPSSWPTSDEDNWPPSLTYVIGWWRSAADMEGITLTRTVKRMMQLDARLYAEVVPAIDEGLKGVSDKTFAEINMDADEPAITVVNQLAQRVELTGRPRQVLDEVNAATAALMKEIESNETGRTAREFERLQEEAEQFMGGFVMDPTMDTLILSRFSQEQYLKAIAFILAHEAAHLWMDGCEQTNATENQADAYAVLVSFELFHNHQSRVKLQANGILSLPELPKDETPMTEWFAESLGWSGFDVVAETFGKAGISPDASHDDFETRSDLVRNLYLDLVRTVVRPVEETSVVKGQQQ